MTRNRNIDKRNALMQWNNATARCFVVILSIFLISCTSDDAPSATVDEQHAIGFDVDVDNRITRASPYDDPDDYNTDSIQKYGFGVYCWYTEDNDVEFDDDASKEKLTQPQQHISHYATLQLMRNQQVTYNRTTSQWGYTPAKYWPTDPTEKLTLRAYAPYTNYLVTDEDGMPWLPVVVGSSDYCYHLQKDPLWGTSKHIGESTADDGKYGELYDNYTFAMSGTNKTADNRDGVIDWYFHHGMAKVGVEAQVSHNNIIDPEKGEYVKVTSITIGPLYNQGLLYIGSHTEDNSVKPYWKERTGNMTSYVAYQHNAPTYPGGPDIVHNDLNGAPLNNNHLVYIANTGMHIIPRDYSGDTPLTLTFTYIVKKYGSEEVTKTITTKIKDHLYGNTIYMLNLVLDPVTNTAEVNIRVDLVWQTGAYGKVEI